MSLRYLVVLALATTTALAGCHCPRLRNDGAERSNNSTSTASSGKRARRGGADVTFFVVSDTHFGFGYESDEKLTKDPIAEPVGLEAQNKKVIERMNALTGRAYPKVLGGTVVAPRGVIVTGDLTEWGRVPEWQRFVAYWGLKGGDGLLKFPVFEGIGNHDKVHGPWVGDRVAERHGGRNYAWDWDDLHFVSLGEAPDDEGLRFLKDDLAKLEADVPIVIAFHLALEGPWSTDNWFADGDFKQRLADTITGHNVVAIFHGHHHATGYYTWRGFDVIKPGAVKNSTGSFTVVHYTDQRMDICRYDYENDKWEWWKSKETKRPPQR